MSNNKKRTAIMKDIENARAIMARHAPSEHWKSQYRKAEATVRIRQAQLDRLDRKKEGPETMSNSKPWECPTCHNDGQSDHLGDMWTGSDSTGSVWYQQAWYCHCGTQWETIFRYEKSVVTINPKEER